MVVNCVRSCLKLIALLALITVTIFAALLLTHVSAQDDISTYVPIEKRPRHHDKHVDDDTKPAPQPAPKPDRKDEREQRHEDRDRKHQAKIDERNSPEHQAEKDHKKEERAKRWGIFLHYFSIGVSPFAPVSLVTWPLRAVQAFGSFAVTASYWLMVVAAVGFVAVVALYAAAAYVLYRAALWAWLKFQRKRPA